MNSTYRVIKKAGFNEETFPSLNEIITVTEPEAAAIFTARYLKEDKKTEFLKVGVLKYSSWSRTDGPVVE